MERGDIVTAIRPRPKGLTHLRQYAVEWAGPVYIGVRNDEGRVRAYRRDNFGSTIYQDRSMKQATTPAK